MNNYGGCFSSETLLRYNQLLRGISDLSFRNFKFVVFLTHPHLLLNCYLSNSILFVSGEYFYCCIICSSLSGWFHKNIYISIICYIKQILTDILRYKLLLDWSLPVLEWSPGIYFTLKFSFGVPSQNQLKTGWSGGYIFMFSNILVVSKGGVQSNISHLDWNDPPDISLIIH